MLRRENSRLHGYSALLAVITALIITLYVLYLPPMPGIADQGDFQRVMSVTGLGQTEDVNSSNSHWFKYVKTEYKFLILDFDRLAGFIPTTSMIYPITAARFLCRLAEREYFSTRFLAFVYMLAYLLALYICLKYIKLKNTGTFIAFTLLSLLLLIDGNYLIWFNSLYGEPMMLVGLLLFISSVLYASRHDKKRGNRATLFVFISALLFLGSKIQCISAMPFILIFIIRLHMYDKKRLPHFKTMLETTPVVFILIFYVGSIYLQTTYTCGVDTEYNSVFFGVLKNSKSPEEDLAVLGLSPDLAVDAGKHAYLPKDQYVKYVPWSELTKTEFNEKISNLKLLRFYLLQPSRLIKGMEYTASQCFDTRGFLGKYEKRDVAEYTYAFKRFTLWSDFRNSKLPKNLTFIVSFYLLVFLISIIEYMRRKEDKSGRLLIELLWLITIIGLLQFPMPYIGNGEADTSKQLFLFNYTFDIVFLAACTWIFNNLFTLVGMKLKRKH